MRPEEAIQIMRERFPFPTYLDPVDEGYLSIAKTIVRHLQPGDKILDFGSGPCDKTAVIQLLGYQCSASDDLQDYWHQIDTNREEILSFIDQIGIDFTLATDRTLPYPKESFDMVMMHHVLEHLHDSPRDLVNGLLELLKPEGYFFATVPNAVNIRKRVSVLLGRTNLPNFATYYWYPDSWRGHVREYTRNDLIKIAEYLGLEIVALHSYHQMLNKVPSRIRPFYTASTNIFPGWRDSWLLLAKKSSDWVAKKALPEEQLREMFDIGASNEH